MRRNPQKDHEIDFCIGFAIKTTGMQYDELVRV